MKNGHHDDWRVRETHLFCNTSFQTNIKHTLKINIRKTCNELIEMGAETSSRDDENWTPLDYAAKHGHPGVVNLLLENDAPVDAVDKNGSTPLHHAASQGHTDCISILLDNNAGIHTKDNDSKNCLDLAVENGHVDACMALMQHKRYPQIFFPRSNKEKDISEGFSIYLLTLTLLSLSRKDSSSVLC